MRIVCIYHSIDLDGWMSAAIIKHWFIKEHEYINNPMQVSNELPKSNTICEGIPNGDSIEFIGYNYGNPIPDLSEFDKVIMVDISFPKEEMEELGKVLLSKFIWIDHHISAIKDAGGVGQWCGLQDTKFAACELTWQFFFKDKPIPEIVRLLGRYDCFGHKGTDEEQKVLEFQYGARQCITNYEEAYNWLIKTINDNSLIRTIKNQGLVIYSYLCTEAKQVYKNGFEVTLSEYKDETYSEERLHKFICINKERFNPINFGIDYHKEGYDGAACFHYANGEWHFSLYNDNGEVDCSVIAKQYGGGGHKGAAGFRIKDINQIIK